MALGFTYRLAKALGESMGGAEGGLGVDVRRSVGVGVLVRRRGVGVTVVFATGALVAVADGARGEEGRVVGAVVKVGRIVGARVEVGLASAKRS